MVNIAEVHSEIAESDHQAILHFAQHNAIDWVIIGPEQPLIDGLADLLRNANIKVFGQDKMPYSTAEYKEVSSRNEALQYVETCDLPIVIKKDGLAAGKGVIIAFTREDALEGVKNLSRRKRKVVFESYLEGEEFSLMTFVNGDYAVPFDCIAQDHKRAFDNDQGPNTGGWAHIALYPTLMHLFLNKPIRRLLNLLLKLWHKKVMTSSDYYILVQF